MYGIYISWVGKRQYQADVLTVTYGNSSPFQQRAPASNIFTALFPQLQYFSYSKSNSYFILYSIIWQRIDRCYVQGCGSVLTGIYLISSFKFYHFNFLFFLMLYYCSLPCLLAKLLFSTFSSLSFCFITSLVRYFGCLIVCYFHNKKFFSPR